jgi:DNA-binding XRE family transcriptional regulator
VPPLETVRRRKLLSQRDLAKAAGVAPSTIYMIEAGKTRPRLSIMRAICRTLDVPPEDIDEFRAVIGVEPR